MKRIISFITAVFIFAACAVIPAAAEDNNEKTVTLTSDSSGVCTSYNDKGCDTAVLSFYKNDILIYSTMAVLENERYIFKAKEDCLNAYARISYIGGNVYDAVIEENTAPAASEAPQASASPQASQTPQSSAAPTEAPTAAPTKTPYPSIYPKSIDAINAPMVVEKNEATMVDGEEYYYITALYQGTEVIVPVSSNAVIKSAPDSVSYLAGQNASVLQAGDVVHMTAYVSGKIKSIEFIYRPEKIDYVSSGDDIGADFKELYSSGGAVAGSWKAFSYSGESISGTGYIFGVPVKTQKNYLLMANKNGKITEVGMRPETIVYTVDNTAKSSSKAEFTGNGFSAITETFVPGNNNLWEGSIEWADAEDITYALVRVIDGIATDIVVFTN